MQHNVDTSIPLNEKHKPNTSTIPLRKCKRKEFEDQTVLTNLQTYAICKLARISRYSVFKAAFDYNIYFNVKFTDTTSKQDSFFLEYALIV